MTSVHTIVAMKVTEGNEQAYLAWLRDDAPVLAKVFGRVGIHSKVVMMSGPYILAHYEADTPSAVGEAFQTPEAVSMLTGRLGALLDPAVAPDFYSEELRWTQDVSGSLNCAAISMNLKPGKETAYLDWVRNSAKTQFNDLWARYDIALKEVFVCGSKVVSYYVIKDPSRILPSFGEPEAIAALQTGLGELLDIDENKPPTFYSQVFTWHD
jgi:hypothetical protein